MKKEPTRSERVSCASEKSDPCLVEDQLPAQGGEQEAEGVQGESQQQHGAGGVAHDRDDLPRPGHVQHQVEQQAEAENEFQKEKNRFPLHGRLRGWNLL